MPAPSLSLLERGSDQAQHVLLTEAHAASEIHQLGRTFGDPGRATRRRRGEHGAATPAQIHQPLVPQALVAAQHRVKVIPNDSATSRAGGSFSPATTWPSAIARRTEAATWSPSGTADVGSMRISNGRRPLSRAAGPAGCSPGPQPWPRRGR